MLMLPNNSMFSVAFLQIFIDFLDYTDYTEYTRNIIINTEETLNTQIVGILEKFEDNKLNLPLENFTTFLAFPKYLVCLGKAV